MLSKLLPLRKLPEKAVRFVAQTDVFQQLIEPFGVVSTPERWIFVVGCYNSGTTLLKTILESHPEIGGLPIEGAALSDVLTMPEELGWTRMWCQCPEHVAIQEIDSPEAKARADRIKRQWSFWFPDAAPNLLEKSIANTCRMKFLQQWFRPAYFIHIVRNGYAVAEGIRRKADVDRWQNTVYEENYPLHLCAEQWVESQRTVEEARADINRLLEVKYERLVEDPREILESVISFLGISPFECQIETATWSVHGVQSTLKNMNDKSFANLSVSDIEAIREVGAEYLSKHNYVAAGRGVF
jgi:hypothetical protein